MSSTTIIEVPKIPKDVRDQQIKMFLKTNKDYPHRMFTIVDTLDAARLWDPKQYPYENKSRLYRDITDGCIDALDQIWKLMGALHVQYQKEILRQDSVRTIRGMVLEKLREDAYSRKPFDPAEVAYHAQLLQDSIQAFKLMMPAQFTELIEHQLKPFLLLLDSTSELAKVYDLKHVPVFDLSRRTPEDTKNTEVQKP